jgi:hypothetical protein
MSGGRSHRLVQPGSVGLALAELLVGVGILGLLISLGWRGGSEALARQRLDAATRRLEQGIQRGRAEAQQQGQACGLSLVDQGWAPPEGGALPACLRARETWKDPLVMAIGEVELRHNFPAVLRFSRNGLVLDGGTAVLSALGTDVQRCLVMSPPLGITRVGRFAEGQCEPVAAL